MLIDQFSEKLKKKRLRACSECGAALRKYEESKFCQSCRKKRSQEFKKHFSELKSGRAVVVYRTKKCACVDCGKPESVDYPDQRCIECAAIHFHRMRNDQRYAEEYVTQWNLKHPFVYKKPEAEEK